MPTDLAQIGLSKETQPQRLVDLLAWRDTGNSWIEGAQWTFTGVGLGTQNVLAGSGKCHWAGNSRFALDLFGPSIAPKLPRCDIAVGRGTSPCIITEESLKEGRSNA